MTQIIRGEGPFEMHFPVIIVGAGGTGLCAALAAHDNGAEALVLERDPTPLGSTAMSTGLIPASGTAEQAAEGIDDSPDRFVADVLAKTKGRTDEAFVRKLAEESVETISWLRDTHGVPLTLVDGFLYPGHSARRMYGTPHRTGGELMGSLESAVNSADIPILTDATVTALHADVRTITGVRVTRPDGSEEDIGCDALILACSGFAGNEEMVSRLIPEMEGAVFHGHPGNKGDAIAWGEELGAALEDISSYQGHGGVAMGHAVPILWPLIVEGGFQVNLNAKRFSNEAAGYSEQAAKINAEPEKTAYSIFDERLHQLMLQFEDYQDALRAQAVIKAESVEELASLTRLPAEQLAATMAEVEALTLSGEPDEFGRNFGGKPVLQAPYYAAKVTGALFHTQGGLKVDDKAQIVAPDGMPFPNLFAGGGAARGISGPGADGYMAGNGLLTATTLGKMAGRAAAALVS